MSETIRHLNEQLFETVRMDILGTDWNLVNRTAEVHCLKGTVKDDMFLFRFINFANKDTTQIQVELLNGDARGIPIWFTTKDESGNEISAFSIDSARKVAILFMQSCDRFEWVENDKK